MKISLSACMIVRDISGSNASHSGESGSLLSLLTDQFRTRRARDSDESVYKSSYILSMDERTYRSSVVQVGAKRDRPLSTREPIGGKYGAPLSDKMMNRIKYEERVALNSLRIWLRVEGCRQRDLVGQCPYHIGREYYGTS